jgi:O-antigen/teichoic acid export membrane protein
MDRAIRARLTRGLGATSYSLVVVIIVQLASVPLFARRLGIPLYGEWLVLSAVPVYLSVSDLGFMSAASHDMTAAMAQGRTNQARSVLRTAWTLLTFLSVLLFSGMIIFAALADVARTLHLHHVTSGEARTTFLLLCGWTLLILQNAVPDACWRAIGRHATGAALSATWRLAEFLAGVVALLIVPRLTAVAGALAGTRLVTLLANHVLFRLHSRELSVGFRGARYSQARRLADSALTYMLFPIGNAVSLQGMMLVAGATLGSVAVVVLNTSRTFVNLLKQMILLPGHAAWPELTMALATGRFHQARRLNGLLVDIAIWGVGAIIPGLVLVGPPLIAMWAGAAARPSYAFFAALAVVTWLETVWWSVSLAPTSINHHQPLAIVYACSALVGVAVGGLFMPSLGLYAVPLGLAITALTTLAAATLRCARTLAVPSSALICSSRPLRLWTTVFGYATARSFGSIAGLAELRRGDGRK